MTLAEQKSTGRASIQFQQAIMSIIEGDPRLEFPCANAEARTSLSVALLRLR
jgi:hypothetical protein